MIPLTVQRQSHWTKCLGKVRWEKVHGTKKLVPAGWADAYLSSSTVGESLNICALFVKGIKRDRIESREILLGWCYLGVWTYNTLGYLLCVRYTRGWRYNEEQKLDKILALLELISQLQVHLTGARKPTEPKRWEGLVSWSGEQHCWSELCSGGWSVAMTVRGLSFHCYVPLIKGKSISMSHAARKEREVLMLSSSASAFPGLLHLPLKSTILGRWHSSVSYSGIS